MLLKAIKLQLPCAQPLTPTRLLEQGLPFLALEAFKQPQCGCHRAGRRARGAHGRRSPSSPPTSYKYYKYGPIGTTKFSIQVRHGGRGSRDPNHACATHGTTGKRVRAARARRARFARGARRARVRTRVLLHAWSVARPRMHGRAHTRRGPALALACGDAL
eukprot:SAG11_NODE_2541_length_3241_cov_4.313495_5_plen_161_part_00